MVRRPTHVDSLPYPVSIACGLLACRKDPGIVMALVNLPYDRSLRAIGHSLESMCVSSFELEKYGEDYLVRVTVSEPARKVGFGRNLVKRVTQMVWRRRHSDKEPSSPGKLGQPLRYTPSDIWHLDAQAESQRGQANVMPDAHKLSQVLRVIGDYLDRKEARAFTISMSTHSVSVWYESSAGHQARESFTVPDLYNRAIHMYLQRSNRGGRNG